MLLVLGMGAFGVRIVLGLLTPLAGAVVMRVRPERNWDGAMLLFAQLSAAAVTYLVGGPLLGLPWYAALIGAVLVGITSYAVRAPDLYLPVYDIPPALDESEARDRSSL